MPSVEREHRDATRVTQSLLFCATFSRPVNHERSDSRGRNARKKEEGRKRKGNSLVSRSPVSSAFHVDTPYSRIRVILVIGNARNVVSHQRTASFVAFSFRVFFFSILTVSKYRCELSARWMHTSRDVQLHLRASACIERTPLAGHSGHCLSDARRR